eukprot:6942885-Pyramimonas_sp.AAC.1
MSTCSGSEGSDSSDEDSEAAWEPPAAAAGLPPQAAPRFDDSEVDPFECLDAELDVDNVVEVGDAQAVAGAAPPGAAE